MTSEECFENKWFYMKYIGKYLSVEILLNRYGVDINRFFLCLNVQLANIAFTFVMIYIKT
jgi:hypothetical protein